ncbi:MAG: ABC transporter permease [Kibdelosporangium sp.]
MVIRQMAWQSIKARKGAFIAPLLALFGGSILLTACGILLQAGLFGGVPVQRFAAAPVVISGNQTVTAGSGENSMSENLSERVPVDARLADEVARIPGVRKVIGDVSFPVLAPGGPTSGHGWASAELAPSTVTTGQPPAGPQEVVLTEQAGVSVGDTVQIAVRAKSESYRVSGIAAGPPAVYFADDVARALSGDPGKVAAIGVFGDPDAVADALAGNQEVSVLTGAARSEAESATGAESRMILLIVSSSFSGFVLMIVIFVTGSTLALVLNQRRREFALLRAIAATPRQLRRLVGMETLLVSAAGALLGVGPGILAGYALRDVFVLIGIIPPEFELSLGPVPMIASVLLCVGAAQIAARSSARRMLKIKPVEALGEAAVQPRGLGKFRVAAGYFFLAVAAAGTVSVLVIPGEAAILPAGTSAMVAVIGIGLLGPNFVSFATRLVGGWMLRSPGSARYLAARNSMANSRRLAAAVTPLVLTIGFAVTQFYSQTTLADATVQQARATTTADFVLTTPTGLPAEAAAAARAVPGVTAATPLVGSEVLILDPDAISEPLTKSRANGVDPGQLTGTLAITATQGDLASLRGDTVALDESTASWEDKRIGDRVPMHLGDRTLINPTVVAIYKDNLGFGDVLLPQDVVIPHTTKRAADSVLVSGAGVDDALRALPYPGLTVTDRAGLVVAIDGDEQASLWLNRILLGVIMLYVALSVVNTLVTATLDRGRELQLLRLVGGTRRQVLRIMRVESWIVVGIAVVVGSAIPVLPLAFLGINLAGSPIPAGSPLVYLGIVALAVLIGLLGIRLPARRITRGRVDLLTRD